MSYTTLKAEEFFQNFKEDPNGVILDVRSAREYEEGHIEGSINVVFTNREELLRLDQSKNYYIHCRVGGRGAVAAFTLAQAGFSQIYNMNDSIDTLMSLFSQPSIQTK